MDGEILVPVLVAAADEGDDQDLAGGAATVLEAALRTRLQRIAVDRASLVSAIDAALSIARGIEASAPKQGELQFDSIQFQLGISAQGTVGFMGSGTSMQSQTTVTVTLKAKSQ